MDRVGQAAKIINALPVASVLDVGCRDQVLQKHLRPTVSYAGLDVHPVNGRPRYVGDLMKLDIAERFDCVAALDVVEHTDDPYAFFDRLVSLARKYLLVSLPNCYSLYHKWSFLFHDSMGEKYVFMREMPNDRHKWVMNCAEIAQFFQHRALANDCGVEIVRLTYTHGHRHPVHPITLRNRVLLATLPKDWLTHTMLAVFTKH
jgi:hypothetical protein